MGDMNEINRKMWFKFLIKLILYKTFVSKDLAVGGKDFRVSSTINRFTSDRNKKPVGYRTNTESEVEEWLLKAQLNLYLKILDKDSTVLISIIYVVCYSH